MKTLIFDAPAHHVLVEGDKEVHGGGEFKVSEERHQELLAQDVPVVEKGRKGAGQARAEAEAKANPAAGVTVESGDPTTS